MPVSRSISITKNTTRMTRTSDDNATTSTVFVSFSLDGHVQGRNAIMEVPLRESGQAELLKGIVCIGDQLSEENISKATRLDSVGETENDIGYLFE